MADNKRPFGGDKVEGREVCVSGFHSGKAEDHEENEGKDTFRKHGFTLVRGWKNFKLQTPNFKEAPNSKRQRRQCGGFPCRWFARVAFAQRQRKTKRKRKNRLRGRERGRGRSVRTKSIWEG